MKGEIVDEDDDAIVNFSNTKTTRQQAEARDEWKQKRDQIAEDMWVNYCDLHNEGDTTESDMDD